MSIQVGNTIIPTTPGSIKVGNIDITKVNVVSSGITTTVWEAILFTSEEFEYSGSIQTFEIPRDGTYKLEVWGAGNSSGTKGGYSYGNIYLTSGTVLYIVIGGMDNGSTGGYNGGGKRGGSNGTSGSGATHISKRNGLLHDLESYTSDILIVAGGAGGKGADMDWVEDNIYHAGGNGGGLSGDDAEDDGRTGWYGGGTGGTQTQGGYPADGPGYNNGYFGLGGTGYGDNSEGDCGGGGGGGYYGGGGGWESMGGGGGSGYIKPLSSADTQSGKWSGNGKAKISLV